MPFIFHIPGNSFSLEPGCTASALLLFGAESLLVMGSVLCFGQCSPVHTRSTPPPVAMIKNASGHCQIAPAGKITPSWERSL